MKIRNAIESLERLEKTDPNLEVEILVLPAVVEFVPYSPITGAKVPSTVKLFEVVEIVTNRMHWGTIAEHPDGRASIWNELQPADFDHICDNKQQAAALLRR